MIRVCVLRLLFLRKHQAPVDTANTKSRAPTAATAPVTPWLIDAVVLGCGAAVEDAALDVGEEVLARPVEVVAELLDRLPDIEALWLAASVCGASVTEHD